MAEAFFSMFHSNEDDCKELADAQVQMETCQRCGRSFATIAELQVHLMQDHAYVQKVQQETRENSNQVQEERSSSQLEVDDTHFSPDLYCVEQVDFPALTPPDVHQGHDADIASEITRSVSPESFQQILSLIDELQYTSCDLNQTNSNSTSDNQESSTILQRPDPDENLSSIEHIIRELCKPSENSQPAESARPESARFPTPTGNFVMNNVHGILNYPENQNPDLELRPSVTESRYYRGSTSDKASTYEYHPESPYFGLNHSLTPSPGRVNHCNVIFQNRNTERFNFLTGEHFSTTDQYSSSTYYNYKSAHSHSEPHQLYQVQMTELTEVQIPLFPNAVSSMLPIAQNTSLFGYSDAMTIIPVQLPVAFGEQGNSFCNRDTHMVNKKCNRKAGAVNRTKGSKPKPSSTAASKKSTNKQGVRIRKSPSSPSPPGCNQRKSKKKISCTITNCTQTCNPEISTLMSSALQTNSVQSHSSRPLATQESKSCTSSNLEKLRDIDENIDMQRRLDTIVKEIYCEKQTLHDKEPTEDEKYTGVADPGVNNETMNHSEVHIQCQKANSAAAFAVASSTTLRKLSPKASNERASSKVQTEVTEELNEEITLPLKRRKYFNKKSIHICSFCKERFATMLSLQTHIKSHLKPYCHRCLQIVNTEKQLTDHVCSDYREAFDIPRATVTSKYGRKRSVLTDVELIKKGRKF